MLDNAALNDLARKAAAGDSSAFESLARTLTPLLIGFFRRKNADAEDLTQQVWVKVISGLSSYDDQRDFKRWLFAIAYYQWVDAQRARDQQQPVPLVEDLPESSLSDEGSCEEFVQHLHVGMRVLNDEERLILLENYWHGKSLIEIAESTGVPYGRVKGIAHRAKVKLRDDLKK